MNKNFNISCVCTSTGPDFRCGCTRCVVSLWKVWKPS